MSFIGAQSKMLFGGPGDQLARSSAGANHQNIPELLTANAFRFMKGPQDGQGFYSFHAKVAAGTTPVGSLTVWYSNLPNPDPTSDADWVQDAGVAAIDLSVVANTFKTVPNVIAEHIRFKAAVTSGTISLILWVKANWST
jgi:hypothetical protein